MQHLIQSSFELDEFLEERKDVGCFIRDHRGRFIAANDVFCNHVEQTRSSIVGKTDAITPWAEMTETLAADDQRIIKTLDQTSNQGLTYHPVEQEWHLGVCLKWYDLDAKHVVGIIQDIRPYLQLTRWIDRLDHENQTLALSESIYLTRREMRLCHMYLTGYTTKEMAAVCHISDKGIEKAFGKIRDKLNDVTGIETRGAKIMKALNQNGLNQFLLEREDWFDYSPKFTTLY